jgi:hypothetical protein
MSSFKGVNKSIPPIKFEYRCYGFAEPSQELYYVMGGDLYYNGGCIVSEDEADVWKRIWRCFESKKVYEWQEHYCNDDVLDGGGWKFILVYEKDGELIKIESTGSNAGPLNHKSLWGDKLDREFTKRIRFREIL